LLNFPVYYLFLVKNDKLLWQIELLMVGTCLIILVGLLMLEKPLPLFTPVIPTGLFLTCIASISVGLGSKERPRNRKNGARAIFSGRQNIEDPIPWSFFASRPHGNACYAG